MHKQSIRSLVVPLRNLLAVHHRCQHAFMHFLRRTDRRAWRMHAEQLVSGSVKCPLLLLSQTVPERPSGGANGSRKVSHFNSLLKESATDRRGRVNAEQLYSTKRLQA